jgi:hypothetical protein
MCSSPAVRSSCGTSDDEFLARLKEDGESLVLRMGLLERERLVASAPHVFYITDHYVNYPAVLVRLPKVSRVVLARVLEDSWRQVAPEYLVEQRRALSTSGRIMRLPRRS